MCISSDLFVICARAIVLGFQLGLYFTWHKFYFYLAYIGIYPLTDTYFVKKKAIQHLNCPTAYYLPPYFKKISETINHSHMMYGCLEVLHIYIYK